MQDNFQKNQANQLILSGLLLFLFGLIAGLFVQKMANPRMGLSAHLEGVMNGMFLVILGLIWNRLFLKKVFLKITFWLVVYGTFANLIAVIIAAITGFGKMMPIAGGKVGTGAMEGLISFLLISLALCMMAACIIVLIGFYRNIKQQKNDNKELS